MSVVRGTGGTALLRGMWEGRLVPWVRNRPVGHERSAVVERTDGGMQISIETELAFGEIALRQSVLASFDDVLRPEWCRIDATINSRTLQIAVDIGGRDAIVKIHAEAGAEERAIPLRGKPLLLPDNCFTLHALSAWSTLRGDRSGSNDRQPAIHTALPIGRDLRTSSPGRDTVRFAGIDLGRPTMTLHIGPDLDEHVWLVDNRVERLAIPRLHVRVDRIAGRTPEGERACTTR